MMTNRSINKDIEMLGKVALTVTSFKKTKNREKKRDFSFLGQALARGILAGIHITSNMKYCELDDEFRWLM